MSDQTSSDHVEHWRYLFSIAYRMLGSVQDAEDVVQEAYVRWAQAAPEGVESPRAYLTTVVTRLAIDRLRSAASKRETYVGAWLPEPLVADDAADPAEQASAADSLSMAFLVVLESLNPVERAVFLLREVFGYEHGEIAAIVERSETNVRQIAHRAREAVEARRPRFRVPPAERRAVVVRFMDAFTRGDVGGMIALLADDVTLRSDGGGVVRAARRPVRGAEKVARFLFGVTRKPPPGVTVRAADVNGQPGLIVWSEDQPYTVFEFEVRDGRINEIFAVVNPQKLTGLRKEAP